MPFDTAHEAGVVFTRRATEKTESYTEGKIFIRIGQAIRYRARGRSSCYMEGHGEDAELHRGYNFYQNRTRPFDAACEVGESCYTEGHGEITELHRKFKSYSRNRSPLIFIYTVKIVVEKPNHRRKNPSRNGSSGSIQNWFSPVTYAIPPTSGMTAS